MSQDISTNRPNSRLQVDITGIDTEQWLALLTSAAKRASESTDKQLVSELRAGCERAKAIRVAVLTQHYNRVKEMADGKPLAAATPNKQKGNNE